MKKYLVELKAKYSNLDDARKILNSLNAKYIGTFYQKDIYFMTGKERLKLRIINNEEYRLVYYLRPDLADIKESKVLISRVADGEALMEILDKTLGIKVMVEKNREIYDYNNVKIHLDTVHNLGTYVEFEKESDVNTYEEDIKIIKNLMKRLGINKSMLIDVSYSDLLI